MNAVLYVGIFLTAFLSLLLLVKKNRKSHDHILIAWLLVNCFQLVFFFHSFNTNGNKYESLEITGALLSAISSPLLYCYVVDLVIPDQSRLSTQFYHFLPFVFITVTILYLSFLFNDEVVFVKDGFIQSTQPDLFLIPYYGLVLAFINLLYPIWSLYLLIRHTKRLNNEFAYVEKINMDWLKHWIILSIIGFWLSFGIIWAGSFQWIEFLTSFQVVAFSITLNVAVIGFFGLRQTTIFTSIQNIHTTKKAISNDQKYQSSSLTNKVSSDYLQRLQSFMQIEKPYLNSQLNLEMLAYQLGMTKHQLSQLINEQLQLNFFNFVNQYRVEEFKKILEDPKSNRMTLLGIALDSGFNSKSSFHVIFKKVTGQTPSAYQKNQKK